MTEQSLQTVPAVFRRTVSKHRERVALRHKAFGLWHDISWNDYFKRTAWIGLALNCLGLEKGDCVSLIGDNCPEWVIADMGIQCIGGVSVGIYATTPGNRWNMWSTIPSLNSFSWKTRNNWTNGSISGAGRRN